MSGHVSTFIVNGGRYDQIFWTEDFNPGMQKVLDAIERALKDSRLNRSRPIRITASPCMKCARVYQSAIC